MTTHTAGENGESVCVILRRIFGYTITYRDSAAADGLASFEAYM